MNQDPKVFYHVWYGSCLSYRTFTNQQQAFAFVAYCLRNGYNPVRVGRDEV